MLVLRQLRGDLGASHAQQDVYDQIAIMAALQLGDLPRVRQLLKARRNTRVRDSAAWQEYEGHASRIDGIEDAAAIRAELGWLQG